MVSTLELSSFRRRRPPLHLKRVSTSPNRWEGPHHHLSTAVRAAEPPATDRRARCHLPCRGQPGPWQKEVRGRAPPVAAWPRRCEQAEPPIPVARPGHLQALLFHVPSPARGRQTGGAGLWVVPTLPQQRRHVYAARFGGPEPWLPPRPLQSPEKLRRPSRWPGPGGKVWGRRRSTGCSTR